MKTNNTHTSTTSIVMIIINPLSKTPELWVLVRKPFEVAGSTPITCFWLVSTACARESCLFTTTMQHLLKVQLTLFSLSPLSSLINYKPSSFFFLSTPQTNYNSVQSLLLCIKGSCYCKLVTPTLPPQLSSIFPLVLHLLVGHGAATTLYPFDHMEPFDPAPTTGF